MNKKDLHEIGVTLTDAHDSFEKGLSKYVYSKTHSILATADLVQDTFMKTWSYLIKGGKIVVMKAFLYHAMNDLIVDEYRKRKNVSLDVLIEKGFEPSVNDIDKLFDSIDGKQVMKIINKLPQKYRSVMNMKYVKNLSLTEMSLITGQSKNTIAVQAHRGLEKLKSLIPKITKIENIVIAAGTSLVI